MVVNLSAAENDELLHYTLMKNYGFPRHRRILNRGVFLRANKIGKRIVTRHLVFIICPNEAGCSRLGLIVSKKVGNAVVRNRVKRVIREAFRLNKPFDNKGIDIIVIPRPALKYPARYDLVKSDFEQMVKRVPEDFLSEG